MKQDHEVISEVFTIFRERGMVKGTVGAPGGPRCIRGAIMEATNGSVRVSYFERIICKANGWTYNEKTVPTMNDRIASTTDDVLHWLKVTHDYVAPKPKPPVMKTKKHWWSRPVPVATVITDTAHEHSLVR